MRSVKRIKPFMKWLENKWLAEPYMRFGQLLINERIVEYGLWTWNAEMSDYDLDIEVLREITNWKCANGRNKLVKDLETAHIEKILETQFHISDEIRKILKMELWRRELLVWSSDRLNGEGI
jgi:hypothetical protein